MKLPGLKTVDTARQINQFPKATKANVVNLFNAEKIVKSTFLYPVRCGTHQSQNTSHRGSS